MTDTEIFSIELNKVIDVALEEYREDLNSLNFQDLKMEQKIDLVNNLHSARFYKPHRYINDNFPIEVGDLSANNVMRFHFYGEVLKRKDEFEDIKAEFLKTLYNL